MHAQIKIIAIEGDDAAEVCKAFAAALDHVFPFFDPDGTAIPLGDDAPAAAGSVAQTAAGPAERVRAAPAGRLDPPSKSPRRRTSTG